MASFIEFPIFTGVSGDLRPWISWLENFFVREKFTADEKMNLAQSLLEGKAEVWFYRNQKMLPFQSWEDLNANLWLMFGDFSDLDRIRRNPVNRWRKTTSTPEKDWETETEALVPTDTIPVTNWTESRDSLLAMKSIQEVNSDPVMVAGASGEKDISCQAIAKIQDIESSSAKASLEKDESHEATLVKVEDNTTLFQILDSWEEELITQNQVPVSKLEHSLQIHNESPNVCESSQDVVGCDELATEENMFSDLSQTSQVWEPGGVLKLKEPVGLVNQKKSRCLKASMFNFKRKKKRIKRRYNQLKDNYASVREDWFNTLSCRESGRKHKHENLQIVSGLLGFNVVYFRCHKEYGLARMINWSQVRVEYSLMQGKLFCKNSLLRNMPSTTVIVAQFKFKHGFETGILIQGNSTRQICFFTYQMSKPEVLTTQIEENFVFKQIVIEQKIEGGLICGDVKFHLKHKWRFRLLQAFSRLILWALVYPWFSKAYELSELLKDSSNGRTESFPILNVATEQPLLWLQESSENYLIVSKFEKKKQMLGYMTRMFKYKSRLQEINLTDTQFLCEKVHRVSCLSLAAQFNSLEIIHAVLEQIIQGDQEASTKIIDKLQIKLKQGMDRHGASWHCSSDEMKQIHSPIGLVDALYSDLGENVHTLPAAEQKSSSIWHRWRRKD